MNTRLESTLIECLDLLQQGRSIEQILRQYPQQQEKLRPLLETAQKLESFNLQPTLAAQSRSREAFLAEAEAFSNTSRARPSPLSWLQRLMLPMTAIVITLLLVGVGLITVSASALPGDPLYGAKRLAESLQLVLTADSGQRADLTEQFRRERIAEIRQLLADGRDADVEFSADIQRIQEDSWLIGGIDVLVNEMTEVSGPAQVGNLAAVVGQVSDGDLTAAAITVVVGSGPIPTETAMPTQTPTSTPASEPVDDSELLPPATAVPELVPTNAPAPEATMTPEPTTTAIEHPVPTTAPPVEPDDNGADAPDEDNSNEDDGDDDNEHGDDENRESNEDEESEGSSNDNSSENDNSDDDEADDEPDDANDSDDSDESDDESGDTNDNDNSGDEGEGSDDGDNSGSDSEDNDNEVDSSGSG